MTMGDFGCQAEELPGCRERRGPRKPPRLPSGSHECVAAQGGPPTGEG